MDGAQIAQYVASGGTLVAALATLKLAKDTREMASSTKDMAASTGRDADASTQMIVEAREDRELAYRPVVEMTAMVSPTTKADVTARSLYVKLRNVGMGPAIACLAIFPIPTTTDVAVTNRSNLLPNHMDEVTIGFKRTLYFTTPDIEALMGDAVSYEGVTRRPDVAVFYEDVSGYRYRVRLISALHEVPEHLPVDRARVSSESPRWALQTDVFPNTNPGNPSAH